MSLDLTELSIVVGTFNRLDQIKRCVESVLSETQTSFVIYITDAGSTDGTIEYLESISSEVIRPLFVGKLLGQAKAYNEVFKQVKTPFVCWISDDNVVINGGLDIAVDILKGDRKIGMVGLKTRDVQGPFIDAPYIGGISEIGILNVNQGMLRTEVLNQVQFFSEAFRDYGIDPDLTAKVLFSGWDIVYTKNVALNHFRNWSTNKLSQEYKVLNEKHIRSKRMYSLKYSKYKKSEPTYKLKLLVLNAIRTNKYFGRISNSKKKIAGNTIRDYVNILGGRYISVLDSIYSLGKNYHLRQRCPREILLEKLPDDPVL